MFWAAMLVSTIVVQVEDAGDLPSLTVNDFAQAIAQSAGKRTGHQAQVVTPTWKCQSPTCSAPNDPPEILRITIVPGVTKVQVIVNRLKEGERAAQVEERGSNDVTEWRGRIDEMISQLYREPVSNRLKIASTSGLVATHSTDDQPTPWVVPVMLGASVVAAGVGIGFGLSSASAQSELKSRFVFDEELDDLSSTAIDHRNISIGLLATAVAGAVASALVLVLVAPED